MRVVLWVLVIATGLVAAFFGLISVILLFTGDIVTFLVGAVMTALPAAVAWACLRVLRRGPRARGAEPPHTPLHGDGLAPHPGPTSTSLDDAPEPRTTAAQSSTPVATQPAPRATPSPSTAEADHAQPGVTPAQPLQPDAYASKQDQPQGEPTAFAPPTPRERRRASKPAPTPPAPMLRRSGLRSVALTRRGAGRPAVGETFVALDLETTGLDPARDRVIEVGAVKFTGDGEVLDEFATLISGGRTSAEAQRVHGIDDRERGDAPAPKDVWVELMDFIAGAILVAHNLEFEQGFITAEARRQRVRLPDLPSVCTLIDARRHFDGRAFSLKSLHRHASGTWRDDTHQALGDARAIMDVLLWMIATSPTPLKVTGAAPQTPSGTAGQSCIIRCRPAPLSEASVAALLAALPQSPHHRTGDPSELTRYLTLLDDVLDDGRLTYDEAQSLAAQAVRTGLTGTQLMSVHHQVFTETFPGMAEEAVPRSRLMQMVATASALGLSALAEDLRARLPKTEAPASAPPLLLRGRRYAFLGESEALMAVRERALASGAPQVKNITKTVLWAAADEPWGQTRQHLKARELNLPIITVDEAASRLEEDIGVAEHRRFEREQEIAAREVRAEQWRRENEKRKAEEDAFWRPTWRRLEHKDDPGPPKW